MSTCRNKRTYRPGQSSDVSIKHIFPTELSCLRGGAISGFARSQREKKVPQPNADASQAWALEKHGKLIQQDTAA